MKIQILQPPSGAGSARGLAVVIDVFRAFSLVPYLFDRGAARIMAVGEIRRATELHREYPGSILIGERHALKISGFDYGNSPSEILSADLSGRTIIHTTHAGTQALVASDRADEVLTGSFVNAAAIAGFIESAQPETVSLVCAGFEGDRETLEDTLCAEYLRDLVDGRRPDFDSLRQRIVGSECARRFLHPTERTCPEQDLELCLDLDRFDFAVRRAAIHEGFSVLERTGV